MEAFLFGADLQIPYAASIQMRYSELQNLLCL